MKNVLSYFTNRKPEWQERKNKNMTNTIRTTKLDEYFVEELETYRNEIYSIENDEELSKLFDELEESEEC